MPKSVKRKVKVWKDVVITIERVVEQTTEDGMTENKTLHYLVNAKYSDGHGVGFRADTSLKCWSQLMENIYL